MKKLVVVVLLLIVPIVSFSEKRGRARRLFRTEIVLAGNTQASSDFTVVFPKPMPSSDYTFACQAQDPSRSSVGIEIVRAGVSYPESITLWVRNTASEIRIGTIHCIVWED